MIGWVKRKLRGYAIQRVVKQLLERLEKDGQMGFLKGLFISKKLGVVITGILVIVFRDVLGLDEATAQVIAALIVSYIVGQSAVDSVLAYRGEKKA